MKTMLLYLFSLLLLCTVTAAGHHQSYETIYVHTDRCNFCAGDTVWFQVYVMDTRQQAESYSHFVYAELLHDTIRVATEKIKVGEEGFAGFFPLPDSIAPGHYTLRFYTLRSAYLLTPYIRGYIEQPASYFSGDVTHDSFRQDLLMLTQAWTAFDASGDTANCVTNIPAETTELIQGRIISNRNANKGIPQATVTLLSFDGKIFKTTKTDPEGYFLFDHLSFVPNTHFLIQAYTAKGGTHVAVQINKEKRPRVERISMLHAHIPETESYEENIMLYDKNRPKRPDSVAWELQMDNVIVTARKQRQKLSPGAARVHSDFNRAYSPAEMTLSPYASVRDFMMHIPGVQYAKDELNVQEYYIIKRYGKEVPAMLIIDGLEVSFGEFVSFPISAVESIEVIKDVAGLVTLGRRAANGAIMLVSKADNPTAMANKKSNFRVIVPQGCQVKQHFYVPHYPTNNESTEKEMRRKTVYWQPDIKIKKGKADIIFTAPPQAPLFMVIQGISANGKLITANKIL